MLGELLDPAAGSIVQKVYLKKPSCGVLATADEPPPRLSQESLVDPLERGLSS